MKLFWCIIHVRLNCTYLYFRLFFWVFYCLFVMYIILRSNVEWTPTDLKQTARVQIKNYLTNLHAHGWTICCSWNLELTFGGLIKDFYSFQMLEESLNSEYGVGSYEHWKLGYEYRTDSQHHNLGFKSMLFNDFLFSSMT